MCINAYKTKWVIVKTNNPISASQKKQLKEINSTVNVNGKDVVTVLSIGKSSKEIQEEVVSILKSNGGYSVVISDKQFSLIKNNWGKTEFPELAKPFTHAIYAEEMNMKQTIPVSDFQFNNRKQF